MKKFSILILSILLLSLLGCSKSENLNENLLESETIPKIVSSTVEYNSLNQEIDILKETLPNNDSGVENPQHEFYEVFGERDSNLEVPDGYLEMNMDFEEARLAGAKAELGEDLGSRFYSIFYEYETVDVLTDDLYLRMKNVYSELSSEYAEMFYISDFDSDGLSDYEEIEVYRSDPNRKSTSGDIFTDGYKIEHNMDLFTVYEQDWIQLEDGTWILPNDLNSMDSRCCNSYPNYLDNPLVEYFSIPLYFSGEIKCIPNVDTDINNIEVALYNPSLLEYAYIDSQVDGEYIHFKADPGYSVYLIYDKSVDIDVLLEPYRELLLR